MGVSVRTAEIEQIIIDGLSNGIPLRQLCRLHDVSKSTVYNWIAEDDELAGRIARARELGFDEIAEEALEIADDGTNDWMKRERADGSVDDGLDHEHVSRSKLRIETRLKLLAKWDPKRYGERLDVNSSHSFSPEMAEWLGAR